jgi:PAS domain S-box-containing protein
MRWGLVALLLAVAISVVVPWLVARNTTDNAMNAAQWVDHSGRIRAHVYKLLYRLRDMEAATYSELQGVTSADLAQRIDKAEAEIQPLLADLRQLTLDNPDQQTRLGALSSVVEHRVSLMQQAGKDYAAGDPGAAYQALGRAAKVFPYSDLAADIVHAEARLQDQRVRALAHRSRVARQVQTGVAAAQLLLLALVVVVSERAIKRRLMAERISRQAVARAERIVQTVREPMVVLNEQLHPLMVNAAFEELYGPARNEAEPTLDAVGEGAWSDEALNQRLLDVAHRGRELWDYELEQTTTDGVDRHMLINARRMQLPDGDEPAVLLSVSDATARTLAENRVNELNDELEGKLEQLSEVNRELEAFSYSVSHDLRAPLRHIAGFSDKLGRHLGADVDAKTSHYLDTITGAAGRMAELIDGLLVYSRLGRGAVRMQPVDMQALVNEARTFAMTDADERDIEWRIGELPTVVGDAGMLGTVWQNLLGNAVKYTARREHAVITVDAEKGENNRYVFTVADNGAGFDMAYADKLFGVFQRMHKASEFPGSGIGLANVRRIIMRHGGNVWAEAEPDHGARFHFSLPVPHGVRA